MSDARRHILIVGSGGREAAFARELRRSASAPTVSVAPGAAGLDGSVPLEPADPAAVVEWCSANDVDLVVVGPEVPLVDGLADHLVAAGVRCLGPSARAAQIEGSKSFARTAAEKWGIPGPRWVRVDSEAAAAEWVNTADFDVVIKADGLAAGKGVVVPDTKAEALDAIASVYDADPGAPVVLEERMLGPEISLIGVSDGATVVPFPSAQDHKRVGEGDTGPNTGGMGAYAPVPGYGVGEVDDLVAAFLQPVIDAMAADGTPFVGFLYAGLMVTDDGPRLIEYNCRFGDPEAQILLPLYDGDLADLFAAAAAGPGSLDGVDIRFGRGAAATVVVCAEGYPDSPRRQIELGDVPELNTTAGGDAWFLSAGTAYDDGRLVSAGGRVLNAVGVGDDIKSALDAAYDLIDRYDLNSHSGLFVRRDIGWRVTSPEL